MARKIKKPTYEILFQQTFNGLPIDDLYEIEHIIGDIINKKEHKSRNYKQTSKLIEEI